MSVYVDEILYMYIFDYFWNRQQFNDNMSTDITVMPRTIYVWVVAIIIFHVVACLDKYLPFCSSYYFKTIMKLFYKSLTYSLSLTIG